MDDVTTDLVPSNSFRVPAYYTERLERHARIAREAYAENTLRGYRAATRQFAEWCISRAVRSLPADAETVAAYIDARADAEKSYATIAKDVSALATMHRQAGADDPTKDETVRLALRRVARSKSVRAKQAQGLTRSAVDRILGSCGNDMTGLRDAALVALAYDTFARRSELVALDVADLGIESDGAGTILIRRSKTDQEGQGSTRYVHLDTVRLARRWLDAARTTEGAIFRRVRRGGNVGNERLDAGSVAAIFKRRAGAVGIDPERVSGHSTRVGAAQDAAAVGVELPALMVSGGWKSPSMPARYCEQLNVRKSAAARVAAAQGRR